jgi:hypothetical protein
MMAVSLKVHDVKTFATRKLRVRRPTEYQKGLWIFGILDAFENDVAVIELKQMRLIWIDARTIRARDEEGTILRQMDLVCKRVTKMLQGKYPSIFEGLTYVDPFRNDAITFSNIDWKDVTCTNRVNDPLDWRRIRKTEMVDLFVYPKNIWANSVNFGMSFRVLQMRRAEPLGCNLFLPAFKSPVPPPPPPPPPPRGHSSHRKPTPVLKVDQESSTQKSISKSPTSPCSLQVVRPSLEEILKSRQKLRITNLLSE